MPEASTLYRLYTAQRTNLPRITRQWFDAFTITPGIGGWRGLTEPCAVIEIIGTHADEARTHGLAADIRRTNQQDSVVVLSIPGVSYHEEIATPEVAE